VRGHHPQNRTERAKLEAGCGKEPLFADAPVRMSPGSDDCPPDGLFYMPNDGTEHPPDTTPKYRAVSSSDRENLVTNQVETNSLGSNPIEKIRGHCFEGILTQLVPRLALCKDVLGETLGAISAVGLLDDLKHQFRHTSPSYGNGPSMCGKHVVIREQASQRNSKAAGAEWGKFSAQDPAVDARAMSKAL